MSTVILCNGNYAKNPYYLSQESVHFYSVEEICYYLYKNAFFVQEDFFCDELLEWIGKELGLESWANTLKIYRSKENGLLHSIEYLFLSTGYYGQEECEKVKKLLLDGSSLSVEERRKMRADAYCKKKRYKLAISEYDELLSVTGEDEVKFRAKLLHNMGVCYAGLFLYEEAAEYFGKAFHVYPNTESYVQLLTALKLGNSQAGYLSYLAEHPQSYEDSLEVESRLRLAEEEWNNFLHEDRVSRMMEEEQNTYYSAVKTVLNQVKREYADMVNKG